MTSKQSLALVVLAAGTGSRYGGLKQIDPVGPNEETILDYSIYDALQAGFDHIVLVINREIEPLFRQEIGQRLEQQCRTSYVYQELNRLPPGFAPPPGRTKPWGTGHAALMAKQVVRSPFAVINADDFYGRSAFHMVAKYLGKSQNCCLVGFRLDHTLSQFGYVSRGICQVDEEGFLSSIIERTHIQRIGQAISYSEDGGLNWFPLPERTPVSMNMWGFTIDIFEGLQSGFETFLREESGRESSDREYFLPAVVNNLIRCQQARFRLLMTPDSWFGVTYQEDRAWVVTAITDLIQQGTYPPKLWPSI
jgi:hypothetical protein